MKRVVPALLVALLIAVSKGYADSPTVSVVDMQRVINESIVGKGARSNLEADLKKREVLLENKRQELQRLQEDLQKQASLLSAAALEEKRQVVVRTERDFTRMVQDQRAEAAKKGDVEMARVVKEIDAVVAELATKGNYQFIIERDPRIVVYSSARVDLTGDVIKMLNEKKIGL